MLSETGIKQAAAAFVEPLNLIAALLTLEELFTMLSETDDEPESECNNPLPACVRGRNTPTLVLYWEGLPNL